ncbi:MULTISPECIES: hypothetical protein [Aeromonas]|jgi:hypothetical protein|uniref:Lipoprotein n=1 Tax=Aeromonas taiwanensis TaxID=633417 RepID=A0A5F0K911_9GAMM|nr:MULTISPECIES: hypothetical protein [Aeromonas]MCO4205119.1 hypothetical protein [Aeromonas taiwanensis]QXB53131.1 hypothetical protein I6L45_10885 [Aeromonas sp. FDAARGOS 1415]TFF74323.1 hypothetical protein DRM93_13405 [Aeromonas taiwanensis]TFF75110.1 hypothetical protein DRM95_13615 [Aeromonas taiwanensis]TFF78540.1 hypothetical protein DRM94_13405 [Aeromonas taiwanensis]
MKLVNKICVVLTCALLAACSTSQPIRNMAANPVAFNLTDEQVANAIITAGISKSWVMKKEKPGLIRGQVNVRQHQAVIDIPYSARDYSINYVSSVNLDDKGKGSIHRSYNRWVLGLNQAIQTELARTQSH